MDRAHSRAKGSVTLKSLTYGRDHPMSKGPRLAILGAGPIGLEAALYAARLDLPFTVYERGGIADGVRQWGHVRLFSPFGMNSTPLGREIAGALEKLPAEGEILTGRVYREAYLEPIASSGLLKGHVLTGTAVIGVARRGFFKGDGVGDPKRGQVPFLLLVEDAKGERLVEADVVLDCTGTYDNHRWLGDGGLPALGESAAEPHIRYGLDDILGDESARYIEKSVLVIGAGYSAATTVVNLARLAERQAGTWVIWAARTNRSQPLRRTMNDPLRERDQLAVQANALATRRDANVEFHGQVVIDRIHTEGMDRGFRVEAREGSKKVVWEIERVVANLGYEPDVGLFRELQVHQCYASEGPMALAAALLKQNVTDCLQVASGGPAVLRTSEPGFFILGAKSFGRGTQFLLRTGFEQVRDCFALLTGKADLDLYKKR
jgi:thioredoxin reductase